MASLVLSLRPPPASLFTLRLCNLGHRPFSTRLSNIFSPLRGKHNDLQTSPFWSLRHARQIRTSSPSHNTPTTPTNGPPAPNVVVEPIANSSLSTGKKEEYIYHGPLAPTFRRLKIFSLSSLTLCFVFTPFIFVIETTSAIPLVARFALAGIALSTSGVSTALVAWCAKPYVSTLRWIPLQGGGEGEETHPHNKTTEVIEMTTLTLGLHKRITKVYDPSFLVPTSRPFAKWELAEAFRMPAAEVEAEKKKGELPREETVAETTDKNGGVVGRWVVQWDAEGAGKCYHVGQAVRYFNVHEELLDRPLR